MKDNGLERCAAAIEHRKAVLEHHEVVIESREAAFNNSSGTSCRSIASLRSAFQHCFAVFKKEFQAPIEIRISGIEDRTQ